MGLVAAKILRVLVFKGTEEPFVMEMPKYRLPSWRLVWFTVYGKAKMYVKKAGTYILLASMAIWFASNYPKPQDLESRFATRLAQATTQAQQDALTRDMESVALQESYLGRIGKLTEPLFEPLGMDWRLTVALETGLLAKEVIVATLGVLYALGDEVDETSAGLIEKLQENIPFPTAVAFVVFVIIYMPCFAATVVFTKESGRVKYTLYLFLFTTLTAWMLSFAAYHVTRWAMG